MGSQQQWQHSTCHQGSSTSQHWGSHLGKLGFLGNIWAVSSSGSTVHAIRAAVPAILASWVFLATNGQSAAVAAQYMPSGQQYHPTLGQQPPGHSVPSHCFGAAILASWVFLATNGQSAAVAAQYMPSGQQYQPT